MFFEDSDGTYYPVSRIHSIFRTGRDKPQFVVDLGDGRVEIASHTAKLLQNLPVQIFPAGTGTYTLTTVEEEGTATKVLPTLVLAWGMDAEGALRPITANGLDDGGTPYHAVLQPDGSVTQVLSQEWATLREYLADRQMEMAHVPPGHTTK